MRDDLARLRIFGLVLAMLLSLSLVVSAQDSTCPAIVSDALAAVDSLCAETGRNEACYGNITLTAKARESVDDLVFETPGDIANVADIQALTLSPMDETAGEWGVSLMQLQANLPDTLPGQNVTVLLFGDVEIENAVDESESSGAYTPMQAFYFRSGVGDAPCVEAPESGILIQTPKGQGQIAFRVDDVDIALGSTVFLQALAGDALYVNLIEGQATVTAFDKTKTVPAGMVVSVPIDENLAASGPPNEPYVAEAIETLSSVVEILPEAVAPSGSTVETTVVDESGVCTVTAGGNVNLRSGPGTVYARAGGLAAGESATPTGQAMGTDGYTWWQLAGGSWVRSDVVNMSGDCDGLPVVTDIPPTPTPAPVTQSGGGGSDGGGAETFHLWASCNSETQTAPANKNYFTRASTGGLTSDDPISEVNFGMTLNGQPLSPITEKFLYYDSAGNVHVQQDFGIGSLPPGTYTLQETNYYSNGETLSTAPCFNQIGG